jgi:hypothetical protein
MYTTKTSPRSALLTLLLGLSASGHAQFTFTTNSGAITITGYTGSGGVVTIPDTTNGYPVTSIGTNAFTQCYSLTSVTIPDHVTNIGNFAFSYCIGLTNVVVGPGVTHIGDQAFFNCNGMKSIYFQGSAPTLGASVFSINLNEIAYYYSGTGWGPTFGGLSAVLLAPPFTCVTINSTITINGYTGSGGDTTIPESINGLPVTSIADRAFRTCTNLTSLTIGTNVTSIGIQAFYQCTSLTNVTIPNSVTSIGLSACGGCRSLTSVAIPASLTNIGSGAFYACTSLTAITVDALNPIYSSADGVLFDKGQTTLIQCPGGKVGSYAVAAGVTNIQAGALAGCPNLTAITVDALNAIYSSADGVLFDKGQTMLIQCPMGKVGSYAVPNSVTNIGANAFVGCPSLTTVTVPASVSKIGDQAFWWCISLRGVYFEGNAPGLGGGNVFYHDSATIYYLPGTTGWGATLGGVPTSVWKPQIQTGDDSFGVRTNQFGFNVAWASGMSVVVEACSNLARPTWYPVGTNTLTSGSAYFGDPEWTNYPSRCYRVRSP